jgi:hypothetical protein
MLAIDRAAVTEDSMAQLGMNPAQDREMLADLLHGLRWVLFVGVGLLGLLAASDAEDTVDYACGLGVFVAVILFLFWETKRYFDGAPPPTIHDIVIEDPNALMIGVPVLLLLGLAGLFVASGSESTSGYYAGLGLAIGAIAMVFLSLKASFDAAEASGGDH